MLLRPPHIAELEALSQLCLRSKAHWGYDSAFIAACIPALTLTPAHLQDQHLQLAEAAGTPLGVVAVSTQGKLACLEKLFVDPPAIGSGVGAALMGWALDVARAAGATQMRIEADPQAVPFYARFGARQIGEVPSEVIVGRTLPLLDIAL